MCYGYQCDAVARRRQCSLPMALGVRGSLTEGTEGEPIMEIMMDNDTDEARVPVKRSYSAPVLTDYGDVRDLTLGSTKGYGESGAPTTFRV